MTLDNRHYLIYKITNIVNGKVYIGETCVNLKKRLGQHMNKDSNCLKLKRAIKKYGKENFVIEEIDQAENRIEAFSKEKFWIQHYKSTNIKYGYNILDCGYTFRYIKPKRVYCYETGECFDSIGYCSRAIGMSTELISSCCHGVRPTCKGKHYCFLDENNRPMIETIKWSKPNHTTVKCVETGEIFNTVAEAAKHINRTDMSIFQCLKGISKTAGGYHWKRVE